MAADVSLFPDLVPLPPPPASDQTLSVGARLTARQRADVEHGRHPLWKHGAVYDSTRTVAGHTCGDCVFRSPGTGGGYPKCLWISPEQSAAATNRGKRLSLHDHPRFSAGPATDCRAWWPACTDWTPR
jgi:hypothetical protein